MSTDTHLAALLASSTARSSSPWAAVAPPPRCVRAAPPSACPCSYRPHRFFQSPRRKTGSSAGDVFHKPVKFGVGQRVHVPARHRAEGDGGPICAAETPPAGAASWAGGRHVRCRGHGGDAERAGGAVGWTRTVSVDASATRGRPWSEHHGPCDKRLTKHGETHQTTPRARQCECVVRVFGSLLAVSYLIIRSSRA